MNRVTLVKSRRRSEPASRRLGGRPLAAFTLLELMLALALTAVVLIAANMAVNLHLRLFESRRSYLEESQLAREVLRLVADDVRSAVVPYEQDVSCISQLMGTSATTGGASSDSSSTGGDESGGTIPEGGSGTGGGSSSGGGQPMDSSSDASEDMSSLLGEEDTSANTEDLSSLAAIPTQPGIYGNQYEIQIDVSRLPRPDQMLPPLTENLVTSIVDIPSDVKTVTYFVINGNPTDPSVTPELAVSDLSQADDLSVVGHGLVRRQLDRCVTEWALNNGNASSLANEGEVIAPEAISIEFMYFDGLEWRTEWDSEANGGLPVAIQIILAFGDVRSGVSASSPAMSGGTGGLENVRYYRTIVHLPVAQSQQAGESTDSATDGTTGSSSTATGTSGL